MTTLAALLPGLTAVRVFTASGTWTKPKSLRFALVEVIGGGGGAGISSIGSGSNGTAGGTTTFHTLSSTGGGGGTFTTTAANFAAGGAGGVGSGGDLNFYGGRGGAGHNQSSSINQMGSPGASRYMPYGAGGAGALIGAAVGGGGAGGYTRKMFDANTLPDSVAVTIGAAGSGPVGDFAAYAGLVVIYEYA